ETATCRLRDAIAARDMQLQLSWLRLLSSLGRYRDERLWDAEVRLVTSDITRIAAFRLGRFFSFSQFSCPGDHAYPSIMGCAVSSPGRPRSSPRWKLRGSDFGSDVSAHPPCAYCCGGYSG